MSVAHARSHDQFTDTERVTVTIRYDTIRYCVFNVQKKLTGSQLSPPHGTNKKLKCETKNKTMSMIGPVQSHRHEGSPVDKEV